MIIFNLSVLILWRFGRLIGLWLGGDVFTGHILQIMAPVVPLIYLEIIMEGILRGLGKQNLSSLNYLAEYVVRISVLLICVPLFGFYGIVASYLCCNLSGNAVRYFFVLRATGLRPNYKRILLYPLFSVLISSQFSMLILHFLPLSEMNYSIVYTMISGVFVLFCLRIFQKYEDLELHGYSNRTI